MTTKEKILLLKEKSKNLLINVIKKDCELLKEIDDYDPKLKDSSLAEKIKWILEDRHDFPTCKICGEKIEKKIIGISDTYPSTCSKKCKYIFIKNNVVNKYGVENVSQLNSVKQKKLDTMISNFGSLENAYIKRDAKTKETISKIPDFYEKRNAKLKDIVFNKYGVENVSQLNSVKQKKLDTMISNFGSLENAYAERELKTKETINKIPDFYEKRNAKFVKTCLEKYGVKNYGNYIRSKRHYKYELNGYTFDSTDEFAYYLQQLDYKKNIKKSDKTFSFFVNEKEYHYWPDFEIDGELIEIKGDHFFDGDKMINPFDESQNQIYEAKHQCMLDNNVTILKSSEIDSIEYIERRYTKDFMKLFLKNLQFPYLNEDMKDKSPMGIIHHFHKSIYDANVKNRPSPKEAWKNKEIIYKVALNRLKYIGRCTPKDILQGLNVTKKAPKVSVFNPMYAKILIEKYLYDCNNIVDPFSGFSGRLLGANYANKEYIGKDLNKIHVKESNEIISFINNKKLKVYEENILTKQNIETFDSLFTCPPYGDKERWNIKEVSHSCDEWIDICLEKYKCKKYLFVVDNTNKYNDFIVEEKENKSHFGINKEKVIYITSEDLIKFKD